jgi:thiol-disulfide isomerase/thioredoxin
MRFIFLLFFGILLSAGDMNAQHLSKTKITYLESRLASTDTLYVINFWATWCAPCVAELPEFCRIDSAFKTRPVKVILVSLDFPEAWPEKLSAFLRKKQIGTEVLWLDESDPNYFIPKISNAWSGAIPATLISCKKTETKKFLEKKLTYEMLEEQILAGIPK